ncbi:cation:proton antiporter subunit C [Deferribacterales bacterium Es71-Z0220]|jgi:multicomponent Na+:H+ antiporter subunit C|uniref:cation:proton antiporter subunit C n=1 Tax=Deferrivibrio essentukiensis TaxID=2880922 RepID=UPI001F60E09E|nr:cation:proton antiporter subunit C [Deferrivibrio essentukiensis]MBZ4671864.1 multisubunit sodium/proton antiporter, MrpC subunit [Deferribacteraceae bacterium]MCB4203782.1 cation:proton antiporter subunit C [Deferrivibrio essentukiensis]
MIIDFLIYKYNYLATVILILIGLYSVIVNGNLLKKVIGLNILSTSVILFYISISKVTDGSAPIYANDVVRYDNPLPHVLMLTAIVVGVAITAVALSVVLKIKETYGTIEEDEIIKIDEDEKDMVNNK